jgi:putative copper resistance protein D
VAYLGESLTDVWLHGGAWLVLADTRFGWICCLRLVLAFFLGIVVFNPAQRAWAIVVATAFLALPAFASHAGAAAGLWGNVPLASDVLHLLSAGAWLGGLPAFALLLWAAHRRQKADWYDFTIIVTYRFSRLAAISVCILLATGIANSWNLLGGVRDLWTTNYGRLVTCKIVLLAAMIAVATVNKFHLTPRLRAPAALRSLMRNSITEIAIGLCVLVFVGYLGRLEPTSHIHPATTSVPTDAAFTHIHTPRGDGRRYDRPGTRRAFHGNDPRLTGRLHHFSGKGRSPRTRSASGIRQITRTECHTSGRWNLGDR